MAVIFAQRNRRDRRRSRVVGDSSARSVITAAQIVFFVSFLIFLHPSLHYTRAYTSVYRTHCAAISSLDLLVGALVQRNKSSRSLFAIATITKRLVAPWGNTCVLVCLQLRAPHVPPVFRSRRNDAAKNDTRISTGVNPFSTYYLPLGRVQQPSITAVRCPLLSPKTIRKGSSCSRSVPTSQLAH